MFWADKVADEIIKSGKYKPYWVDDMFTPSGFAHVGSLRGPLVHDIVYKALKGKTDNTKWTYIMNDFDPIDGLPPELEEKMSKYYGLPVRSAPSPYEGYDSYANYFAKDFQKVLRDLGVEAEFLSSWDMYHEGKFNEVIRIALDNSEKIQDIYQKVSGSQKREKGWLPLQVICENCGKIGTIKVHDWDGKTVAYTCEPEMVKWAKGCGHKGRISPFDGNGKLPWKVDWPAHWRVMGVTIEGAGKDHSSAGGSRDIARALCDEVFKYPDPFNLPYEFFLIGGKKMSSSKGLGLKARELTDILPAQLSRFLFTKTDYKRAIEFDPVETMAIPVLFDEYQKAADAYFNKSNDDLARSFELSQISEAKKPPSIRFSVLAQWVQMPNMEGEIKKERLEEWAKYARVWIDRFAPEDQKFAISKELPEQAKLLSGEQKKLLLEISRLLGQKQDAEAFQTKIYEIGKEHGLNGNETFQAIYLSLIGKDHGPKAAWLILSLDSEFVKTRFEEASGGNSHPGEATTSIGSRKADSIAEFTVRKSNPLQNDKIKPDVFSIDKKLAEKFPSISVGIAIIKGVSIREKDQELEKEKNELLSSLGNLTTEDLGQHSEIESYRKLYRDMGIDWHSRRPSPEALLRRVVLKKGLYTINTCVDAYNLVVMKNRVSVGAFDLDKIEFPTILRFANEGEGIHLLGDDEETTYKSSEIAYFDQKGGYNMDFNYRDAQRTAVNLNTKNLYINVDGVFDITPEQVEKTLREASDKIIKYCGGILDMFGVEAA